MINTTYIRSAKQRSEFYQKWISSILRWNSLYATLKMLFFQWIGDYFFSHSNLCFHTPSLFVLKLFICILLKCSSFNELEIIFFLIQICAFIHRVYLFWNSSYATLKIFFFQWIGDYFFSFKSVLSYTESICFETLYMLLLKCSSFNELEIIFSHSNLYFHTLSLFVLKLFICYS